MTQGELLVAAAAGSGKTAVLVERLLRQIVDPEHAIDLERFLVVTFTKAAAQEMRERVRKTLEESLFSAQDGLSEVLLRQLNRLPLANITTLHAFCLDLIRRYFYLLGLDPAFRVADAEEIELLRQDVLEKVLEENYEQDNAEFLSLVEAFGSDRDDQPLMLEVVRLYDFANSQIEPEEWLQGLPAGYYWENGEELWNSPWGESVRQGVSDRLQIGISYLHAAERLAAMPEGPGHYLECLGKEKEALERLRLTTNRGNWQSLQQGLHRVIFERLPNARKGAEDPGKEALRDQAKSQRDEGKKILASLKEEFRLDVEAQLPSLEKMGDLLSRLVVLVQEFTTDFTAAKRQRNVVDFADLEHMAYRLLREEQWGIAASLREEFVEVLVDEYQDINAVQEGILRQVARSQGNMFMVGDVKQSIYRFRMADPGLFLKKYKAFPHFPENAQTETGEGRVIDLSRNFRSRLEIVAGINFIFSQIMTEGAGEIAYDDLAALKYGAQYATSQSGFVVSDGPIEVHILDGSPSFAGTEEKTKQEQNVAQGQNAAQEQSRNRTGNRGSDETGDNKRTDGEEGRLGVEEVTAEELEGMRREAYLLAQRLSAMVAGQEFRILDPQTKEYRPVKYSDVVILLRSYSANASIFQEELTKAGIPVFTETSSGYFSADEVETVLSLLKVIGNPHQDIPLAAVLRSPLAEFSGAELGKLRVLLPEGDFFEALAVAAWVGLGENDPDSESRTRINEILEAYAEEWGAIRERGLNVPPELQAKATLFWGRLERWREYADSHLLSELLALLYEETHYLAYCGTLPNGQQRQSNLRALYDRAVRFEETHYRGLFRFLRFLERFRDQGQDLGQARVLGENEDVVRIMTVHASKGLEFPVVFVAGLGKRFNFRSLSEPTLLHSRLGLGISILDLENRVRYPSIIRQALRQKLLEETLAEELRILYVAMTRAKEKLVLYGSSPNLEKALERWHSGGLAEGALTDAELRAARSFLDWIGAALVRHPGEPLGRRQGLSRAGKATVEESRFRVEIHHVKTAATSPETLAVGLDLEREPNLEEYAYGDEAQEVLAAGVASRLEWTYPFPEGPLRSAKTSVSALKHAQDQPSGEGSGSLTKAAFSRPQFLETETLTPAERGSALHLVMQHLPLLRWRQKGIERETTAELDRRLQGFLQDLENREILTALQVRVVSVEVLIAFLHSGLGQRMLSASEIWREVPFTLALPTARGENPQLVQGVIDALIFAPESDGVELVDYKTDHVPLERAEAILRERYRVQLAYYARAVESLLKVKVSRATLYAFSVGREIDCEPQEFKAVWDLAAKNEGNQKILLTE